MIRFWIAACLFCLFSAQTYAQTALRVAAASNLQSVITALQTDFKHRTGITVEVITGSSGKLVAQINNGAPFDVFLSADMHFADILYDNGLSAAKPVIYATGNLIICSSKRVIPPNWAKLLTDSSVKKIAIANPIIAPYGKAAREALEIARIYPAIQDKLVFGENIAQTATYITTGVVDAGFTSRSLLFDEGLKQRLYWQPVDPKTYRPIHQGIIILKRAANNVAAKKFHQYILSRHAKRIFKKYGYTTPN